VGVEDRVASCVFRPRLADYVSTTIKKRSHVLVEGSLVSTTYERGNDKGKKAKTNKQTFRCIRADVVRKLDRANRSRELSLPVLLPRELARVIRLVRQDSPP